MAAGWSERDSCRDSEPGAWQHRVGAATATLALSLQAFITPSLALDLQQPGIQEVTAATAAATARAAGTTLAELDAALRLPAPPAEFPPLPPLSMPKYQELVLPNGLRLFLMEDHEVPLVRGSLLMKGGQRGSPDDKVGIATISAGVQRAGGSTAHPEAVLNEALEDRGAYIEGGAALEYVSMGFSCLAEDVSDVLELFSEVVLTPALPQGKLDLYKAQVFNYLEHQNDDPRSIPGRELAKLIYGKHSVFARTPTPQQVQGIGQEDVRQYLSTWERPDMAILGIVGDFNSRDMTALVQEKFGGWQPAAGQPAQPPPIPNPPLADQSTHAGTMFLINVPGSTQASLNPMSFDAECCTSVALGEVGIQLMDPDDYPLDVLNDILNSFGGRLFDEIRSREGLAYSVQGGWAGTPPDHPGLFLATAETARPGQLMAALRQALQEATEEVPRAEEVARAKESNLNQFVFNFASSTAQLQRLVAYTLLGVPRDYLFQYQRGIEAVEPAQVLAAAQRHLHPSQQTAVVVGDVAKIRPELEGLGWRIEELKLEDSS
ncbi:hypothetical protein N2152v2_004341 [Parachlorella kessleri]